MARQRIGWARGVLALAGLLLVLSAGVSAAAERVALVIGNAAYQNVAALANPRRDAEALATRLTEIGFDVTLAIDLDAMTARRAVAEFAANARGAAIALVYYAGHGIEIGGRNYLIPVDALMQDEIGAKLETVDLDAVAEAVSQARDLGLVLVDACRDNPFLAKLSRSGASRSLSRGLAPVTVEDPGLLVSFAAQPGQTAADGTGRNSPYASALLEVLGEPGLEVGFMFRKLGAKVRAATNGTQVPMERMQLPDKEIYLVPAATGPAAIDLGGASGAGASAPAVSAADAELDFLAALQSGDRAALDGFVRRHPDHPRAADARRIITGMVEAEIWQQALASDSESAYQSYLLGFPEGRYRAEAEARLLALVPPTPVAPAMPPAMEAETGPASCFDLWYERNAIFAAKGYCFTTAKAREYFDTSGCTTSSPKLSAAERRRVDELKAEEGRLGC